MPTTFAKPEEEVPSYTHTPPFHTFKQSHHRYVQISRILRHGRMFVLHDIDGIGYGDPMHRLTATRSTVTPSMFERIRKDSFAACRYPVSFLHFAKQKCDKYRFEGVSRKQDQKVMDFR